jgi:hypothetical protein
MYKLETFYQHPDFRNTVAILKAQRRAADGLLYCEHCQQPIIKKYDCIAHHMIELTTTNVNDINISLNPDNIQLIHFSCHNKHHKRFGYQVKKVYLVYGAPCSGKSTWVNSVADKNDIVVDMDNIYTAISTNPIYTKPNTLKRVAFKVRDSLYDVIKVRYGDWSNAFIVGGFPKKSERERMITKMGCEPIFIDTAYGDCVANLNKSKKPDEWFKYIDSWFREFTE